MHQDYSEHYVVDSREQWPDEQRCGELIVKHLLSGDRGHYGPLEHPQITVNVGYFPHSMMQQVRTHRVGVSFDVQCLAGDTEVTFVKASGSLKKIKISELCDLWMNGEKAVRERKIRGRKGESPGQYRRDCKPRLKKMNLRVLNEDTGVFEIGHLQEVFDQGIQPVYRLTLEDGRTLDCTENHRLLTDKGWQTMREAVELIIEANQEVISYKQDCYLMANGVIAGDGLYKDRNWLQEQLLAGLTARQMAQKADCSVEAIKKWIYIYSQGLELEFAQNFVPIQALPQKPRPKGRKLKAHAMKVVQVRYLGLQQTYDIEVAGQWHNFVANGVVVHNSFRYTGQRIVNVAEGKQEVEEVFYLRPVGHYTNRQGKRYFYSEEQRAEDLIWCIEACQHYKKRIDEGLSEEHARGLIPFDARQHFVLSCNMRSLMHLLDLRWKKDAQLEAQKFCELLYLHFEQWSPAVAQWYKENRAKKAKLSP
jgi:thymidylate synthase (FAD)